jgi:TonB family protein
MTCSVLRTVPAKFPGALLLVVAAAIVVFASNRSLANNIKVIANPSVNADTISAADLRRVFLEEKNSIEGAHVEPVLEHDGPVHEAFLQEYVGKSGDDLETYYRALVFTGRGSMPKVCSSDSEVVAYVAYTRGAIGYVSSTATVGGVKTLAIGIATNNVERKLILRVRPEYPDTLRRLNIGGTVRLRISITAQGNVEDVHLLGGNPILGDAAALAVKQWVYAPFRSRTVAEVSLQF